MRTLKLLTALSGLLWLGTAFAQASADAPAGSTGICKDGSYTSAASKRGACSGHKGVQTWYATSTPSGAATAATAPAPASPAARAPAPQGAASAAPAAPAAPVAPKKSSSTYTSPVTPAAGGGPGLVWVNSSSKVYHCQGDRWYGKTKSGSYMTEAEAKTQGNRPDHNKPCQ